MKIKHLITAILLSLAGFTGLFASAQEAATSAIKATSQFQVGNMYITRFGSQKKQDQTIILIPGLASGAWVWEDTVKRLEKDHQLYVVTLAGFDGRPAADGPFLEKARLSLLALIQEQKLDKPVLLGHSMGATLSIWFAQTHSDLISGIVAVDGLPVFPGTENLTAEQRSVMASNYKAQLASQTPEVFASQQLQYMRNIGVIDATLAQNLAQRTSRSNPLTTANYVSEIINMDLRKDMAKIEVPLLEISPYHDPDFAARQITMENKNAYYQSLLQGAPRLQVQAIRHARHFVMLDQPQAFADMLQEFLKKIEKS